MTLSDDVMTAFNSAQTEEAKEATAKQLTQAASEKERREEERLEAERKAAYQASLEKIGGMLNELYLQPDGRALLDHLRGLTGKNGFDLYREEREGSPIPLPGVWHPRYIYRNILRVAFDEQTKGFAVTTWFLMAIVTEREFAELAHGAQLLTEPKVLMRALFAIKKNGGRALSRYDLQDLQQ